MGLNNAIMDIAADDLCHCNNLSCMCFESPQFQCFIRLLRSRIVGLDWRPPCHNNNNRIAGELFDTNYQNTFNNNMNSCMIETNTEENERNAGTEN